jgi:hypothetical protein
VVTAIALGVAFGIAGPAILFVYRWAVRKVKGLKQS